MQSCGMPPPPPPPFVTWAEDLRTETVGENLFWLNLSEGFFFGLPLILGENEKPD